MNVINKLMFGVMFLCSNLTAYEATVDYAEKDRFSIDGYDFFKKDESLPILKGKAYDIVEEAEEVLAGESYRKIIRITDPISGEYDIFTTRIINDTKKAVVERIVETYRKFGISYANFSDGNVSVWFKTLDLSNDIFLEDGGVLHLHSRLAEIETNHFIQSYKVPILPGDEINVLWDRPASNVHFAANSFGIQIARNGTLIGGSSWIHNTQIRESLTGIQREDNVHKGEQK